MGVTENLTERVKALEAEVKHMKAVMWMSRYNYLMNFNVGEYFYWHEHSSQNYKVFMTKIQEATRMCLERAQELMDKDPYSGYVVKKPDVIITVRG